MWLTFCRRGKVAAAAAAAVATTEPTQSAEKNPKMMKRRKLLFLLLTTTTGQPLMIVEDLEEDWDRLDEAEDVRVREEKIGKRGEKCEYSFDLI